MYTKPTSRLLCFMLTPTHDTASQNSHVNRLYTTPQPYHLQYPHFWIFPAIPTTPVWELAATPKESLAGVCTSWNKGWCVFPGVCKIRHVCATCYQAHMARDCTATPVQSVYKQAGLRRGSSHGPRLGDSSFVGLICAAVGIFSGYLAFNVIIGLSWECCRI